MVKNMIKYIFIYTTILFMIGCENKLIDDVCQDCTLELDIPSLSQDENGYYEMYHTGDIQTFATIRAFMGSGQWHEQLGWATDTYYLGCVWNHCDTIPVVNQSSWSNTDGIASTVIGIMEEHVGDIITVYAAYEKYGVQYYDFIKVRINANE
tara:strand:+ start:320 stop:775 length:456 start_codon:yes stop_codon:yes gene_type:complete